MKILSLFLVFLVFVSFVNFHSFGRFLIDEPLVRGHLNEGYFTVRNTHDRRIKDVNVKLYIYNLGLSYSSSEKNIPKKDHILETMFMSVPSSVKPGLYLTKITVGNDDFRDTQHVYLRII